MCGKAWRGPPPCIARSLRSQVSPLVLCLPVSLGHLYPCLLTASLIWKPPGCFDFTALTPSASPLVAGDGQVGCLRFVASWEGECHGVVGHCAEYSKEYQGGPGRESSSQEARLLPFWGDQARSLSCSGADADVGKVSPLVPAPVRVSWAKEKEKH